VRQCIFSAVFLFLPFKGEVRRGMGVMLIACGIALLDPIPTPALPLKGREK